MAQATQQFATAETTGSSWQVILDGELLETAQQAVEAIAAGLAEIPKEKPAATLAELALFYGCLSEISVDNRHVELSLQYLNAAIDQVGASDPPPWLIGGYPEVAWVITQLAGRIFDPSEADACIAVDERLLKYLNALPTPADYDLICGVTGIGVYSLARLPAPSAVSCLHAVVARLAERAERIGDEAAWFTAPSLLPEWQKEICPNGYYNLGLAHGVPAVIGFLARACAVEPPPPGAKALLEDAVRWVLSSLGEEDGVPFFPEWLAPEITPGRGRLAWCYGDLGSACALLYAARLTGQSEWEAIALRILRYAARNRGEKTRVYDAGLCHGALGNAHLFNRIFQATGEDIFRDAACFWYARAFELRQPHVGVAGFAAYHPDTSKWVESFEMFNGAAGAGLALLAASSDILPAWDECMMVSIPPRS